MGNRVFIPAPREYEAFLDSLKARVHRARMSASLAANAELVTLYLDIPPTAIKWSFQLFCICRITEIYQLPRMPFYLDEPIRLFGQSLKFLHNNRKMLQCRLR